jgi:hypothetical protein
VNQHSPRKGACAPLHLTDADIAGLKACNSPIAKGLKCVARERITRGNCAQGARGDDISMSCH